MIVENPTISKIREICHQISDRFFHGPKRIIEYYIELQKKHKDRLLD